MKTRNTSKDKEWTKVASRPLFNLYRHTAEPHLWKVRLRASGGYIRRRFHAPNLAAALEEAPRISGLESEPEKRPEVPLSDAFRFALEASKRASISRNDWFVMVERFLVWLRKQYPLCTHWELMTRTILRDYLATYEGRAANTKRLAIQPILQTAGYMHREHGFTNFGERLGIGSKLKSTPPLVYREDVLEFCDWLITNRPHLEAGVCLQGLAGLQLLEALRLTWDKVDLDKGLIEISGEVKNVYRNRVIPVAKRVVEALRRIHERRRPFVQQVLVGMHGLSYEEYRSYGRQVRAAIKQWNRQCDWAPKDLRNCMPTFASIHGIHSELWEQYIGHAPRTVTGRHYVPRLASSTTGERAALERQMALFRRVVVDPFERGASAENGNIWQLRPDGSIEAAS